jgi:sugar lactone lactonase YvrE
MPLAASLKLLRGRTRGSSFLLLALAVHTLAMAQSPVVYVPSMTTLAGNGTAGFAGDNGPATAAQLSAPGNVVYDAAGNLYIADTANNVIRKISAAGVITTIAGTGGTAGFSGDGGPALSALLNAPNGLAVDASGNLYIADTGNARIREITLPAGTINTIAGNGTKAVYTANGPALTSPLDGPNEIALDAAGNVYIADSTSNRCLEYVKSSQQLILFAGASNAGGGPSGDNGQATAAKFTGPRGVATDNAGNVYLVDKAHSQVRKVNIASGIITTVAGNGTAGFMGDGAAATAAELDAPTGAFVDANGNLYIADAGNNRIRLVSAATGFISTIAGNGTAAYTGDGGAPTSASLSLPSGVAVSPASGQIAIADTTNNAIRGISALSGAYPTTLVGANSSSQNVSANITTATTLQSYQVNPAAPKDFIGGTLTGCTVPATETAGTTCVLPVAFTPTAPGPRISQVIARDASGNQYNFPLYGVGSAPAAALGSGTFSVIAGTASAGYSGDGGAATSAQLNAPLGTAFDATGNLYIADSINNVIRSITPSGTISTFAGTGLAGYTGNGGAASKATLSAPSAVALDDSGNVYIADTANSAIRQVSALNGTITTVAGTGTAGYSGDGGAASAATLRMPAGIVVDSFGNLYIADTANNVVREVVNGTITTIVGTGATAGALASPTGLAIDASGNLYIADTANNAVRKWSNGTLTLVAGTGVAGSSRDGGPATSARLNSPTGVAVDAAGDLYIADSGNQRVRSVSAQSSVISTVAGTGTAGSTGSGGAATAAQLNTPTRVTLDSAGRVYIADTANNRIARIDSAVPAFAFGSVNVGTQTAPQTAVLTNFGNLNLAISALTIPAGFTQTASGGTDCTATSTLTPGGACMISVVFQPAAKQGYSGNVTITDNALNNASSMQSFAVSGLGTIPSVPTTITIKAGNIQTTNPLAPFATPLQVVITDQNGVAVSGVSVTFNTPATGATGTFTGATNIAIVTTDATGTATAPTLTAQATLGQFSVSAAVAVIPTAATFTETIAGKPSVRLAVSLSPSTSPQTYGTAVTLTASLTPATFNGSVPSGTITFLDAGTSIGTATLNNATASLTITPPATSTTAHMYSASYSGDANFSASTNANTVALAVNPLSITATATPVTTVYSPLAAPSPAVSLTGTLNGVLPADQANVTATYTSAGLKFTSGMIAGTSVVGVYPITAILVSNATANNYMLASTSGQVTITKAGTVDVLTTSNATPGQGSAVTFTATITSLTTGTPTGSVSFYSGATLLGTSALNTGVATFTTSALLLGSDAIASAYSGDTNYTASSSPAVNVVVSVPGFSLTSTNASVSVAQGDSAYLPLTLSTVGSFTGTVNLTCSGLPANAACIFVPASYTTSATVASVPGIVQLVTAGPGTVIGSIARPSNAVSLAGMFVLPGICSLCLFWRRRSARLLGSLALTFAIAAITCLSGCGSSSPTPAASLLTPTGTSTVVITATSGSITSTFNVTLNVTAVR